jgi:DNA-binding HxlR family transcriptional regulator
MSPRHSSRPDVLAAGAAGDVATLDAPDRQQPRAAPAEQSAAGERKRAARDCAGGPSCCPRLHEAVELVGKRWTGAILAVLLQGGPMRFSEIAQAVPALSDRLLSERVKELEKRGMVERRVAPSAPARVEYELTPMGRDLAPALGELEAWAHRWLD